MEPQNNPEHLKVDGEDDSFTMECKIEVVDDIEAQVEEMMRLGALGYFKEARQLSQSIAPAHQQTFEVVFEQLRLMLDQGAYTDLIEKADSHPKNVCTAEQSDLIALMVAIAHVSMNGDGSSDTSEALSKFQHMRPAALSVQLRDRFSGGQWTIEELLKDVLLLRLWYLEQLRQPQHMNSIDNTTYACLVDVAFSLLEHEQFWVTNMLFHTACFDGFFDSRSLKSPTRWSTVLKRVEMIDDSTFGCRLTQMTMAQIALEWAAVHTYITSDRTSIIDEAAAIWTRAATLQTNLTLRFRDDDYGPRNGLRHEFAVLLDSVRRKKPWKLQIIGKAQALQTKANYYEDRGMHHVLESLILCTVLESQQAVPESLYVLGGGGLSGFRLYENVKRPAIGPERGSYRGSRQGSEGGREGRGNTKNGSARSDKA
ncbi:hypothetical protein D0864_00117 [Hortaea werneckii]|uniref:Uncharacterized protein n=1 Tax=Hortaea werneckii TaxID=91943 RepID=A0A3M7HN28_HORWE|nr:hypothetical protein D0864_00117 [Hortaea werneckii]